MSSHLIDANKALFAGNRAETRRILADYRAQHPNDFDFEQAQWLEAHAQDDDEHFIQHLYHLIEHGDSQNHYVQMALAYLDERHQLEAQVAPTRRNRPLINFGIPASIIVLLLIFVLPSLLSQSPTEAELPTATANTSLSLPPTEAPIDRSQALFGERYTARFSSGILQILAIEDRSERILNIRDASPARPVPGARFIALSVIFECRSGICRQPPQADLFLQLDNADLSPIRSDIYIDASLEPVALGRTTEGWIIFEVPVLNRATGLVIRPFADELGTRPPDIVIELPIF